MLWCALGLLGHHVVVNKLFAPRKDVLNYIESQHPEREKNLSAIVDLIILDGRLDLRQIFGNSFHLVQTGFPSDDRSNRQLDRRRSTLQVLKLFNNDVAQLLR